MGAAASVRGGSGGREDWTALEGELLLTEQVEAHGPVVTARRMRFTLGPKGMRFTHRRIAMQLGRMAGQPWLRASRAGAPSSSSRAEW